MYAALSTLEKGQDNTVINKQNINYMFDRQVNSKVLKESLAKWFP